MDRVATVAGQPQAQEQHVAAPYRNGIDNRSNQSIVVRLVIGTGAVVLASSLAFQLLGTGLLLHFFVLIIYGGAFCALGAFVFSSPPSSLKKSSSIPLGSSSAVASDVGHEEDAQPNPSFGSCTPSPLQWMGEAIEGSMGWLMGESRVARVNPHPEGNEDGREFAQVDGESTSVVISQGDAAGSSGGSPLAFGRAAAQVARGAFPSLGTGASQAQPAAWSLGFGASAVSVVGAGVADSGEQGDMQPRVDANSFGDDDDDSVHVEGEGAGVASGDGGLTAAAEDTAMDDNGAIGGQAVPAGRPQEDGSSGPTPAAEHDGNGPLELNWEVNGRRQMLRRSITSAGAPTEDNLMVQDLLEMVSDTPVDHAGQWRPVRVRRGIHIWTSTVDGSPYCRIRGRMRCEATPAQLLQLLIDDDRDDVEMISTVERPDQPFHRIGEYDGMFDRYELVERPNDRTAVRWTCYRAIWPTRPRDFVIKSTWEEFADGTIVIATKSMEHERYPETPTFVRGKMVTCGYVICPLGESRRRRRNKQPGALNGGTPGGAPGVPASGGADVSAGSGASGRSAGGSPEGRPSSEFTLYAHTDLGGNLPASVINKLCKKPAYRVLRKVQDMIATDTLVKRAEAGEGDTTVGGGCWSRSPTDGCQQPRMRRSDSEEVLGSLVVEGMPDRDAAANLEDVPGGEVDGLTVLFGMPVGYHQGEGTPSGVDGEAAGNGGAGAGRPGSDAGSNAAGTGSQQQPGPSMPSVLLPGLARDCAVSEARRIMKALNRMASDEELGWSQLGVPGHRGMALYRCPVIGTKKVRLGASTCVSALASELVGILLENAAMLGPDYIVDRQELLETFTAGVNTGEGGAEAAARLDGREPEHDTAIYWFSCTHKRQRICRDFVILRCFRPLPGGGGVIAYSSVDHPGLPPCPDYVRGRLDVSGFVIVPGTQEELKSSEGIDTREQEDGELGHLSDGDHDRRSGPRRGRLRRATVRGRASTGSSNYFNVDPVVPRRRSRSSAPGNGYGNSEDEGEPPSRGPAVPGEVGEQAGRERGAGRGSHAARRRRRCSGISEVTFFTHLTFSAYLPDFQEMEAVRHFVGPLHILQELKRVVEQTLGSSGEDDVLAEAAAKLQSGGLDGGPDWSQVQGARRRSSTDGDVAISGPASGRPRVTDGLASGSVSETESAPPGDAFVSNAELLRVSARREAVLRDMLAFSSDGECMDGPQVDWRLIKHGDGTRLWRANVPGTVWCMIRTRTVVPAAPSRVLAFLLDDACIPQYDELFDKIEVIETVDGNSAFKRTCYKPIWPTAPRDFSLLCSWGALEDGTTYLLNRSVDHPQNPPVKGCVRGVVMLCGFLMVPRAPAEGGCTITMIVHTDLGGSLPAGILNHLSTSSPWRLMQRLRAIFEREEAERVAATEEASRSALAASQFTASSRTGSREGMSDIVSNSSGVIDESASGALGSGLVGPVRS